MTGDTLIEQLLRRDLSIDQLPHPLPDAQARDIVARLEQAARHHWHNDRALALDYAADVITIGQRRGDLQQQALGTMISGDLLAMQGRVLEGWEALASAGDLFLQAGDAVGWARTRIGRLPLSVEVGAVTQAWQDALKAETILREHQELDKLLRLKINAGVYWNFRAQYPDAIQAFQEAMSISAQLGDAAQNYRPIIANNLGYTYSFTGDFQQSEAHYQIAYDLLAQAGHKSGMAMVQLNLGYLALERRRYSHALKQLLHTAELAGDSQAQEAILARRAVVECYLALNRSTAAREEALKLIDGYRSTQAGFGLARTLLYQAAAEADLAQYAAARAALDDAESIYAALDSPAWLGRVALLRGQIALKQGDMQAALTASAQAEALFTGGSEAVYLVEAQLLRARVLHLHGELTDAAALAQAALKQAQALHDPALLYTAHLLLGRIAQSHGQITRAMQRFRAAAATIERLQRQLTITMRASYLADKGEALQALINLSLENGQAAQAWAALEKAKAQIWQHHLLNREQLIWPTHDPRARRLIDELQTLREMHYRAEYAAMHLSGDEPQRDSALERQAPRDHLARIERQMRGITEQLYLLSSADSAARGTLPHLRDVQACLRPRDVLLEYYSDGCNWWVFIVTPNSIDAVALPTATPDVRALIDAMQTNIDRALRSGADSAVAHTLTHLFKRMSRRLHDALIAPVIAQAGGLADRFTRVIVVPYGELHYIPFHLLYSDDGYLIDQCEVVTLPVSALITRQAPQREGGARVLAHSWGGQLPHTVTEAAMLQTHLPCALHTEDAARREALAQAPVKVLHIAAHGKQRIDQPEFSHIELADGRCTMDDLLQLDLGYELVVLSGCETGRARVTPGDELVGLGQGILYAGAGALIASLWRINDAHTVRFMELLYAALVRGEDKAAALRRTQTGMRSGQPDLHPAYWGAFQLVGSGQPLSPDAASPSQTNSSQQGERV